MRWVIVGSHDKIACFLPEFSRLVNDYCKSENDLEIKIIVIGKNIFSTIQSLLCKIWILDKNTGNMLMVVDENLTFDRVLNFLQPEFNESAVWAFTSNMNLLTLELVEEKKETSIEQGDQKSEATHYDIQNDDFVVLLGGSHNEKICLDLDVESGLKYYILDLSKTGHGSLYSGLSEHNVQSDSTMGTTLSSMIVGLFMVKKFLQCELEYNEYRFDCDTGTIIPTCTPSLKGWRGLWQRINKYF